MHAWGDRTEDGEKREWRMSKHGKQWTFQSKVKSEVTWITHAPLELSILLDFRDLLWRKYQRRRASYEDWLEVDREVKERERLAGVVPSDGQRGRSAEAEDEP